jgi:hypothetical protein
MTPEKAAMPTMALRIEARIVRTEVGSSASPDWPCAGPARRERMFRHERRNRLIDGGWNPVPIAETAIPPDCAASSSGPFLKVGAVSIYRISL